MRSLKASLVSKPMSQRDVTQFVRHHHRQRGFVGQHIKQAAAHHDGVADGERFQRRGQQDARADFGVSMFEIVGDDQIVDDRLQNLVDFAFRRDQANLLQALDGVVFRLALPQTLALDRRRILGGVALICTGCGESTTIWVNSSFWRAGACRSYPQSRVCALKWSLCQRWNFRSDSSL